MRRLTAAPPLARAAAFTLGFALLAAAALYWTRRDAAMAAFWPANGLLAAACILLPANLRWGTLAVALVLNAAIALALGYSPGSSILFATANGLEAGLAAVLALRFCGVKARRIGLRRLVQLLVIAVAPAAFASTVFVCMVGGIAFDLPADPFWRVWFATEALGMALTLPAILLISRAAAYPEFRRGALEAAALYAGLAVLTAGVFAQSSLPLLFVPFPAMVLIAFRLGPAGAALAGLQVVAISVPMTVAAHGPTMLSSTINFTARVHLTEGFAGALLFTGLAVAGAVADQSRLHRRLIARERALRAARQRARPAIESPAP